MEEEMKPTEREEDSEYGNENLSRRVDRSLLVALVAVAISLIGTVVSIYEAQVLREQQNLMAEQKSAAAWPYAIGSPTLSYHGDSSVTLRYNVINNGIGPAILGDVRYLFDGEDFESYNISDGIQLEYDSIYTVHPYQNIQMDSMVIKAGETITAFTIVLKIKHAGQNIHLANEVARKFSVQFCYCSVYGDCWFRGQHTAPRKRSDCKSYLTY